MSLNCGIVGLPNVGKSTLFNALTNLNVAMQNRPFCTIEPHVGIVDVPDPRLAQIAAIAKPAKIIPAITEFVDIAGLIAGASKGEGLGNKFLNHIRQVDAIAHVVRCFDQADIIHVNDYVDPKRDIEIINTELLLADLSIVEQQFHKFSKLSKTDKEAKLEAEKLETLLAHLNQGLPARTVNPDALPTVAKQLITYKKMLYIANVDNHVNNTHVKTVHDIAIAENAELVTICANLEAEIASLTTEEDKKMFLEDLGCTESGLERMIQTAYRALNLATFFTVGPKELRAWTIPVNINAENAAGTIHTDFAKGFIRAEVTSFADFIKYGGEVGAKNAGKWRLEGRDYLVQDGDIMHFRFNV